MLQSLIPFESLSRFGAGVDFVWPDDLEYLVYRFLRAIKLEQRRLRATLTIQRYTLTRLTRRWFEFYNLPGLIEWNGIVTHDRLFWPCAVVMHVSLHVIRRARPGSIILRMPVADGSAWQHLVYVAVYWRKDAWHISA